MCSHSCGLFRSIDPTDNACLSLAHYWSNIPSAGTWDRFTNMRFGELSRKVHARSWKPFAITAAQSYYLNHGLHA